MVNPDKKSVMMYLTCFYEKLASPDTTSNTADPSSNVTTHTNTVSTVASAMPQKEEVVPHKMARLSSPPPAEQVGV